MAPISTLVFFLLFRLWFSSSYFDSGFLPPISTLVFLLPKILELFVFPILWLWTFLMKVIPETLTMNVSDEGHHRNTDNERIWWRLSQKHWLWTYLMKVITETLTMNVSDEGYHRNTDYERIWWRLSQKCAPLTMNVSDEGYHRNADYERIWWRLSQKRAPLTMNVSDEGYHRNAPLWLWTYLMKVITETRPFEYERIWWRLSQKRPIHIKLDIHVFILILVLHIYVKPVLGHLPRE